jgi:hypothetical protein
MHMLINDNAAKCVAVMQTAITPLRLKVLICQCSENLYIKTKQKTQILLENRKYLLGL